MWPDANHAAGYLFTYQEGAICLESQAVSLERRAHYLLEAVTLRPAPSRVTWDIAEHELAPGVIPRGTLCEPEAVAQLF